MDMYDDYKDSGITWTGMVPSEWEVEPLWTRCDAIVPMRDKPTSFDGNIPWVKIEDFQGKYIYESKSGSNVSRQLADSMNMKSYPVGTVLCSCSCDLGKCAIVGAELYSNQTFIGLVADGERLISSYLYYLMQSSSTRLNYLASGSIQTYLSKRDFLHLKMVFPPLLEQEAISNYLDSKIGDIDSTINNVEKSITLLNEYRQSTITEAVTHGLDPYAPMKPSGIEWVGDIPTAWSIIPLKYIIQSIASGTSVNGAAWPADEQELGVLSLSSVFRGMFRPSENKQVEGTEVCRLTCPLEKGSLLISRCNTSEWVGTAAYVDKSYGNLYCPDKIWQLRFASGMQAKSIKYYLDSKPSRVYFESMSVGASSSMQNISKEDLLNIPIVIPDDAAQIVDYLDTKTAEIDALIASKERQVELLREYRKSIISEAVTGKFKVPGLE